MRITVKRSVMAMLPGTALAKNLEDEGYLELLLDGTSGLEERFSQIDSRRFLEAFTKMKSYNKNLPAYVNKLIREEHSLDKTEEMRLAPAS
jgi:hypothetical protein